MPNKARAALLLGLGLAVLPAAAALYKWVDAEGKTQYSDQPPKNYKGEVIRLEVDAGKATLPPSPPEQAPVPAAGKVKAEPGAPEDMLTKRRNTRTRLEAQLKEARDKAEAARKALSEAEPTVDERQVIQQRHAVGGMHGMTGRSNCRIEGTGRQRIVMCPSFVPTEVYNDRVTQMEEDLRKAEEALSSAEEAWRRGVD